MFNNFLMTNFNKCHKDFYADLGVGWPEKNNSILSWCTLQKYESGPKAILHWSSTGTDVVWAVLQETQHLCLTLYRKQSLGRVAAICLQVRLLCTTPSASPKGQLSSVTYAK
jgi:hypothetical protein